MIAAAHGSSSPFVTPRVAWPSLAVLGAGLFLWSASFVLRVQGSVHPIVLTIASTLAVYVAFTPLHEAMHRSLARSPLVSAVAGRLAAILFVAPFPAARHFHLEHHQHTNDPVADPDAWSGQGPRWALPLRWATQDLHYYRLFFRSHDALGRADRLETILSFAAFAMAAIGLGIAGFGELVLFQWVLPARLAIFFLAYALDYLPHRPYDVTAAQNRYMTTRVREGLVGRWLLLGQGLHLIHHLYPGVPFYRYHAIWAQQKDRLVARGARVV